MPGRYELNHTPVQKGGMEEFAVITTVSSRHMDVTEPLKTYAEQKAGNDRIDEQFD